MSPQSWETEGSRDGWVRCYCLSPKQGLDGIIKYDGFKYNPTVVEPKEPVPETG